MPSKKNNALAAIRQLACLGLPYNAILPELVDLIRRLVGFECQFVVRVNHDFQPIDAYVPREFPLSVGLDYMENFHNRSEGEGVTGFTTEQMIKSPHKIIHHSRFIERHQYIKTELYNRVARPSGVGWSCQMPLRDGVKPLGSLALGRPFMFSDYSERELSLLEMAQPWICHAFATSQRNRADEIEYASGDSGVLIVDTKGMVHSASPGALKLLFMANGIPQSAETLKLGVNGDLRPLIGRIAKRVDDSLNGADVTPPFVRLKNDYGSFQVRAYTLNPFSSGAPGLISLHIERFTPLSVSLFRSPKFLELSPRERDVCLLIVTGYSNTEIAFQLDIKPASVIDYRRSLYLKLGIQGQKELLNKLLSSVTYQHESL